MKVKIIRCCYYSSLENIINDFIEDKEIINISFTENAKSGDITALILYKEE